MIHEINITHKNAYKDLII